MSGFLDKWISLTAQHFVYFSETNHFAALD